ncbi:unnamed protein product [Larinioides sclopetarius]|uniref:DDE Tnp4 domain-containing protein n=1 Tax=Larinioides sclopetarius TaxID=280406 RepID=A0AAV2BWM4_9ARAC
MDTVVYAEAAVVMMMMGVILKQKEQKKKNLGSKMVASTERKSLLRKFDERISSRAILKVVCNALILVLKDYLKTPATEAEWESISEEFRDMWQFPMCIGALDEKHVKISPPPHSGSI